MYSLRVVCPASESEVVIAECWAAGTVGISEEMGEGRVVLLAGFESEKFREELLRRLAQFDPEWCEEPPTDWTNYAQSNWPAREVGDRIFLAPIWSAIPTPTGRIRIFHSPGLACGTGEHPCTQLALAALEDLAPGCRVADVGTGSGLLSVAALKLGARAATGLDIDFDALAVAKYSCDLNGVTASLINGSAECLASRCSDLTVANISATVLLNISEELKRITKNGGKLILTGFGEAEAVVLREVFPVCRIESLDEWFCLIADVLGA